MRALVLAVTLAGLISSARAQAPQREPSSAGRGLRWTGIGLMALGLAAAGGGLYFTLEARDREKEVQGLIDEGQYTEELADAHDKGQVAERNQIIGFAAGGALALGGVVLYWMGVNAREEAAWKHGRVALIPGGAALLFEAEF